MTLNILGLDVQKTEELVQDLNVLLANFQVYYQNLRGIHWNIKGKGFFELHTKFEELYNDSQLKVDEIAERVLTLGGEPFHTFQDYVDNAQVPVGKHVSKDEKAVELIVSSISELLKLERNLLDKAGEANDEGTNAMMSDFIAEQEKTIWMMNAWLNK
ncbi:Dps family protein [uncultured Kordia sp.]|uniref:Dps family protein n=1 Tax=uncultured Kordia sp. TaxID=507699 RepID=UPI002621C458|nr:Dps family protein [uncultured Kordia sp.]